MKRKSGSLKAILFGGMLAVAFVTAITWKSFDSIAVSVIAGAITFGVFVLTVLVLGWLQKDDEPVKPGSPRLK
jgi:hypothetical protein